MANRVVKTKAIELPDPADYPEADVVIFDGDCRFCTRSVERLFRWDGKHRLAFLSLHDERIKDLCPDLSHDQLMEQMYVVRQSGNRLAGANAFRYLTGRLPRLWPLFPLLHIPFTLPLWSWIYRQVAKHRYKLGRTKDACEENGVCDVHFRR